MTDTRTHLLPRHAAELIKESLDDTPAVMVIGPRQCGKTTLVRDILGDDRRYITLDDETQLRAVSADPVGYIRDIDRAAIDEVQHVPSLLRAIKKAIDDDRRPGRFLLTGSANVLTLPKVSESLAGRMSIVHLLPLAQSEIRRTGRPEFLDRIFAGRRPRPDSSLFGHDLVHAVLTGGYPEMLKRTGARRRSSWARDYLEAIIQRDVKTIADIERIDKMPALLRTLAAHAAQLANLNVIAAATSIDHKTASKYLGIFEQLFLLRRLPAWSNNRLKRLVKAPKIHFLDPGLLATLTETTEEKIARDRTLFGPVLECFVFGEILKQVAWSERLVSLGHYRDKDQYEVDIVVESSSGDIVGLEVKAAASVRGGDFNGLRRLAAATGDRFKLGLVLYDGNEVVPFGKDLFAAPVSSLWTN